MLSDTFAETFEQDETGKAAVGHGYTYSGHPVGAAAALACLNETIRLNVPANAAARGAQLYQGLLELQAKYDVIGDVRGGHGLMCAMELVGDRTAKTVIGKKTINGIQERTYQAGAMVRVSGPNIILSPPLVLTEADVVVILSALNKGLADA